MISTTSKGTSTPPFVVIVLQPSSTHKEVRNERNVDEKSIRSSSNLRTT